jgi:hypothetical protein
MQVYAATLAQLGRDGAKLALVFADRGDPATCGCGVESRCKNRVSGTAQQKKKGVDQLWTRILKLAVLRLSGQA